MARLLYCWRCRMEIPMLEEHEWEQVLPELRRRIERIQHYRQTHAASLQEAKQQVYGEEALERYYQITGSRETNINALWHHRLSFFGPPCQSCGKPLRTPRAKWCTACGASR